MTLNERETFADTMNCMGDVWTTEDVMRVYPKDSLDDALRNRMSSLYSFTELIKSILAEGGETA